MKKIAVLLPALVLLLASCEQEPYADFIASSGTVEVYESVYFTNTSSDYVDYFEWDFGDGTWSDAINPVHSYEESGTYEVTLSAFRNNHVVDRTSVIVQVLTTSLRVIVEEYYDHYRVAGASVILYPTLDDWDFQTNAVIEGFTDNNGIVTFDNLNPAIYYLDVWQSSHNNYQLAEEDIGWMMTDQLYRNEMNEFVAYVDYIGSVTRLDGKKVAQYKLLKMEPRIKKYVQ